MGKLSAKTTRCHESFITASQKDYTLGIRK